MKTILTALLAAALTTGATAAPVSVTVHIKNFRYRPATITVHTGDRVAFINDDDEAHTVTAADRSFDSEGMDTNQKWQHVFRKPGKYSYFCELHPYMKAIVIVLPARKT